MGDMIRMVVGNGRQLIALVTTFAEFVVQCMGPWEIQAPVHGGPGRPHER